MRKLLAVITTVVLVSVAYVLAAGAETTDQQEAVIVQNSDGDYVGTVMDALIDSSGNIRFVIVSIGEKVGQEQKKIAVPITSFSTNGGRELILDVSKEKLAAAPEFKGSDLGDPNFAGNVYQYFGLVPSWPEGKSGESL